MLFSNNRQLLDVRQYGRISGLGFSSH